MKYLLMAYLLLAFSGTGFAGDIPNADSKNNSENVILLKASEDFAADAAYVEHVQHIDYKNFHTSVKVFSYSGGDPAMNGTYLNLAVFSDIEIGWLVFELGNIRSYEVAPITKDGFLKIYVKFDDFDSDGNIVTKKSTYFLDLNAALKDGTVKLQRVY